jgi:hypothetical protein
MVDQADVPTLTGAPAWSATWWCRYTRILYRDPICIDSDRGAATRWAGGDHRFHKPMAGTCLLTLPPAPKSTAGDAEPLAIAPGRAHRDPFPEQ